MSGMEGNGGFGWLVWQRNHTQFSFSGYRKVAFPSNVLTEHRHHEPRKVLISQELRHWSHRQRLVWKKSSNRPWRAVVVNNATTIVGADTRARDDVVKSLNQRPNLSASARDPVMPRLRVELRTMLALVAALAILLGWAKSWGWPGDLVLSVTQFPLAWLAWSVVGLLVGQCICLPEQRSPLLARLYLLTCVAILVVGAARMRSFRLWFPREETLTWPDYWIVQADYWLRSRVEIPDFWKRNCTHSPATIVLGIAVAILAGIGGLLMRFQRQARGLEIDLGNKAGYRHVFDLTRRSDSTDDDLDLNGVA
jgi:hypothetical protein